ncbi:MAG TPA: LON peptidase substrate-binding domain-containing protein [Stellaceae bacterium]|jgi:Lon protease-like protein|nr:LON peptidase substrate-binding domain-containing protein [Stellaceae bacterium]
MSERPGATALCETLPIFPLAGVLLLPRGQLPLNIFEPRYLAMTRDALGGDRLIGMVQPSDPNQPPSGNPPVYPTGCAGRITSFSETEDGRYLITLTGLCRFRIREELPLHSGYRRVVPQWDEFASDLRNPRQPGFDRQRLIRGLRSYFERHQIKAEWDAIAAVPGDRLVTSIAMVCPFEPSEKQALLEAGDIDQRAELLTAIVEMAVMNRPNDGGGARH